jgi:hypothetical protein
VPAANRKDIDDIPEDIREGLEIVYVGLLDEVLPHVFNLRQPRAPREVREVKPRVKAPAAKPAPAKRPAIPKAPAAKRAAATRAAKPPATRTNGVRSKPKA